MSTVTYDTLQAAKKLREAGYDEKQAELIVQVISESQDRLVTREHFDSRFNLLHWMIGVHMAMTLGIFWKLFR
jgi:hypothetical protein